jgi:hypothetical protein
MKPDTITRTLATVALLAALGGCAQTQVKAWDKAALAKASMALDGNVLESRFADHTFQSKEGSRGSASVGGGGCGCN